MKNFPHNFGEPFPCNTYTLWGHSPRMYRCEKKISKRKIQWYRICSKRGYDESIYSIYIVYERWVALGVRGSLFPRTRYPYRCISILFYAVVVYPYSVAGVSLYLYMVYNIGTIPTIRVIGIVVLTVQLFNQVKYQYNI